MVFSSLTFLYLFLPLTLLFYTLAPRKLKNAVLLVVSLIFYAWGEPIYIFLMIFSSIVDYTHGMLIEKYRTNQKRTKMLVLSSVIINLGLLSFFKYAGFVIGNINMLLGTSIAVPNLPLPIGISFYTFQTMSYTIDVYRGDAPAQRNPIALATYVTLFPQLIAGPIVRYRTVADQINNRRESIEKFSEGVTRFVVGLGKKVLLANNIGLLWSQIQSLSVNELTVVTSWLGIAAFAFQIYFDFSGYSDMAIGLGKIFGFDFLENFNYPFISQSITEFWRRWHISLGTWFKDYVYIPLGGNRKGLTRTYVNLFVVWFLTGLWHGASWNFVLWGLYFGLIIAIEKAGLLKVLTKMRKPFRYAYVMFALSVSWVLFAFDNLAKGFDYIRVMFGMHSVAFFNTESMYFLLTNSILLVALIICSTPLGSWAHRKLLTDLKGWKKGAYAGVIVPLVLFCVFFLSTAYLVDGTYNPFLYFRF